MTSHEILRADLLDILFDNRNKAYGAYTLRKYYNGRLGIALGLALGMLLVLFALAGIRRGHGAPPPVPDVVVVKTVVLPPAREKKLILPPPRHVPAQKLAQSQFTPNIAFVQHDPAGTMADQSALQHDVIGDVSTNGPEGLLPTPPVPGPAALPAAPPPPKEPAIQREPEFPGGPKAWLAFLGRNLQVPAELLAGEKKTVLIRFLVATDGSVTGFEVLHSAGHDFDEEVIRVLRRMPKWKPAIQNSQPVARSFTQPVTFMAEE